MCGQNDVFVVSRSEQLFGDCLRPELHNLGARVLWAITIVIEANNKRPMSVALCDAL